MALIFPDINKDDFTIDNSALDAFSLCPRRYMYRHIFHLTAPLEAEPLTFGSAFHAALESYYAGKTELECAKAFIKRATEESSKMSVYIDDSEKSEYTVQFGVELLLAYMKSHTLESEPFTVLCDSSNVPYLEVGFALSTGEGIVVGKIDGLINLKEGGIGLLEHKTTSVKLDDKYAAQYNPNNQVALYLAAIREYFEMPQYAIINAIRVKDYKRAKVNKEDDDRLWNRFITKRSSTQLDQRLKQIEVQIEQIKRCIDKGFDGFWQNAPQACFYRFKQCPYVPLCKAQTPELVEIVISGGGYKVEKWEPYDIVKESSRVLNIEVK